MVIDGSLSLSLSLAVFSRIQSWVGGRDGSCGEVPALQRSGRDNDASIVPVHRAVYCACSGQRTLTGRK